MHTRYRIRTVALLCALCVLGASLAAAAVTASAGATSSTPAQASVIARINHYRSVTWRWQRVLGEPTTRSEATARRSPDVAYRRWVLRLWRRRAAGVEARATRWLARRTSAYEQTVAHWKRVMGRGPIPVRQEASASRSLAGRWSEYVRWRARAEAVLREARNPPHERQWLCIHHYEGSWTDTGAPYWGGLQMSLTFQQRYGGYLLRTKGTADHWTPLEQMWVADRALASGRGFYPWPNTARMCGLI